MATTNHITVEVAYALPNEQVILSLEVPSDCVVEDAIKRSGILENYPQIDISTDKVGIFGKMCKLNSSLRDKDRIEIYRKLIADPKESRRQKAEIERKKALQNNAK
ncbi:MAG: RnfH family protein [Gammaproteobacteria bacterium]|nr:MAG: RnfH family protein [Gammaproteobacteria bacterium]RKZ96694.1 MAG: RnfH family protein [Gammaproteobacteria bacterium]RLA01133.1 MAG: RnfH family protein [Gammaproteobacteria bacterium]